LEIKSGKDRGGEKGKKNLRAIGEKGGGVWKASSSANGIEGKVFLKKERGKSFKKRKRRRGKRLGGGEGGSSFIKS